jgi:hypothetical protein
MTPAQKRKFLFGELRVFGALGMLVVALFTFAAVVNGATDLLRMVLGALFALGLVILAIFYVICWLDIRRSKRRYESQHLNPRPAEPNLNPRAEQILRDVARRKSRH